MGAQEHSKKQYSITLLGCGKMGMALLRAWLDRDLVTRITIIDPHNPQIDDPRVSYHSAATAQSAQGDDLLVLAVKPQILAQSCAVFADDLSTKTAILSIAAGQSLKTLEHIFSADHPIIRTMPNTPAAIGKGITVAIGNNNVTADHKLMCDDVLQAAGGVSWINDEVLMDAVTALSGSGPAYIFYLIEALAKAGEKIGLSSDTSMLLARQTVIGSAALAERDAQTPASILRQNVTSPNGTTQAALNVLMDGRFDEILIETLQAAKKRSEELNS